MSFFFFYLSLGCTNCVGDGGGASPNRWTMPLHRLGGKQYYLGVFFKVGDKKSLGKIYKEKTQKTLFFKFCAGQLVQS